MKLAKVMSKGQITIPKDIREKMKLKTGDNVLFSEENGKFFLQNANSIEFINFKKKLEEDAVISLGIFFNSLNSTQQNEKSGNMEQKKNGIGKENDHERIHNSNSF